MLTRKQMNLLLQQVSLPQTYQFRWQTNAPTSH